MCDGVYTVDHIATFQHVKSVFNTYCTTEGHKNIYLPHRITIYTSFAQRHKNKIEVSVLVLSHLLGIIALTITTTWYVTVTCSVFSIRRLLIGIRALVSFERWFLPRLFLLLAI